MDTGGGIWSNKAQQLWSFGFDPWSGHSMMGISSENNLGFSHLAWPDLENLEIKFTWKLLSL